MRPTNDGRQSKYHNKGGACLVRLISYLNQSCPALRVERLLGRQGLYQLSYSRFTSISSNHW